MLSAILFAVYNIIAYGILYFFSFYVIAAVVITHAYCKILGTPRGDVCTLIAGRFCLFILGNGFVGISDLSQTGTQTDITSWTHILAQCKSNTVNSLEREVFICCDRESCIDECRKQEGFCLCNLSALNLDNITRGLHFFGSILKLIDRQTDKTVNNWKNMKGIDIQQ